MSDEPQTGAMVALIPTKDAAELLAISGGESASDLHCTLFFLGDAAAIDPASREAVTKIVADLAVEYEPVVAEAFAVSLFNPHSSERKPCVVLGLSGRDLTGLHREVIGAVAEELAADGETLPPQHQPWIPHITLAYDPAPDLVGEIADLTGPVLFDRLRVAFGDTVEDYPLAAAPVAAAAGHDTTPGHDELHHYWTKGEGLAKWVTSPTPWTTLVALLAKHPEVGLHKAKIFASRWFIEVFGYAAGSDKNRVAHGHPPRGHLVGPG